MNLSIFPKDLPKPIDDGACNHLTNKQIPDISLPNQDGNLLKLKRSDTFRLIIYCYPMTGNPEKAADSYRLAIKYNPYFEEAFFNLGFLALELKQFMQAIDNFNSF